jgi:glucosamine 6-phosphate synthetase-like amidotransferase/phosphosugar isomerase protein
VLAIASDGCKEIAGHVIYLPNADPLLQVVLGIVPLQLFAYLTSLAPVG